MSVKPSSDSSAGPTSSSEFRYEINALRAFAVLAVLAYHFKLPGISGGFAGVDVFFVISGFLISSQILDAQVRGNFSYRRFYTRPYREFVAELQRRHPRLEIYDPTPLLCDTPRDLCPMTQGDSFLYSYGDHLSDHASSLLARDFLTRLDRLP